jgi:5-methylthioadenosine/S-adenosylhomocysteine deaminase
MKKDASAAAVLLAEGKRPRRRQGKQRGDDSSGFHFWARIMLLVKNGTLVDCFGISKSDILIDNGKIAKIGKGIREKAEKTIDAKGKIVIPGLVNMHTHLSMSLLRNTAEGKPLDRWLDEDIFPAERMMEGDDFYLGGYAATAECLLSGTTTALDKYYFGSHRVGKAADELNMRAFLTCDIADLRPETKKDVLRTGEFIGRLKEYRMAKPAVGCHAIYTCSKEVIIREKEFARKHGLLFSIHIAETRRELFESLKKNGLRPVEYLDRLGILDAKTELAHASWVTKREIGIIAKSGAVVTHCPVSNLKLATGGIMPLEQYREAGAHITLGTDSASSNNSLDMIETMKVAGLLQKHRYWDACAGNPREILKYATYEGARALGLDAGRIKEGCLADLVILDPKENMVPLGDIYTAIVYSCSRRNVETVIVGGKISVEGGKLLKLSQKTMQKFAERAEELRQKEQKRR